MDKQQIELVGIAALTAVLIREGFEIARPLRDRGVDLIIFSDDTPSPLAIPLQVKIHSETGLEVFRKKYQSFPGIVYALVWQALTRPRYFFFDHDEATTLIPEASRQTDSWTRKEGHWTWTHPKVPQDVQERLSKFENRWDWLHSRLLRADSAA
jgi:hypothetical protein